MNISSNSSQESIKLSLKPSQRSIKGLRGLSLTDRNAWEYIRSTNLRFADSYSYHSLDLPFIEQASFYSRTAGKNSHLVQNELLTLKGPDKTEYALRPEVRMGMAKAYIEQGLYDGLQPFRMYYEGYVIKKDQAQADKLKQSYQGHFAAFGSPDPLIDAQLIYIAYKSLISLGLEPLMVYINTIATAEIRSQYRKVLVDYFRDKRGESTGDARKLITKQPFDILTSTDEAIQPVIEQAPQLVDFLDNESQQHFMKVLEYLDELEVPYFLKNTLISDDETETHTLFEITTDIEDVEPVVLARGGRFDTLLDNFVSKNIPAGSVTILFDRVIRTLQSVNVLIPNSTQCDIFVAQIGEEAKKKSLQLFEKLRDEGLSVAEDLAQTGLKQQLTSATEAGVKYALILGQKEVMDDTIMVRDMENGIQEIVDFKKVVPEIKKRLSKELVVKKQRKSVK